MENHARSNKLISQLMQNLTLYSENNDNFQSTNDYIQNVQKKKKKSPFQTKYTHAEIFIQIGLSFSTKLCFSKKQQSIFRAFFRKERGGERNNIRFKLHASLVSNFIHVSLVTETWKMEKATKSEVKKNYHRWKVCLVLTVRYVSNDDEKQRFCGGKLREPRRSDDEKIMGTCCILGRGNRNEFERAERNRKEGGTMEKGIFFFFFSFLLKMLLSTISHKSTSYPWRN